MARSGDGNFSLRAIRALDRNGDGVLDQEEVQQALREFYTSDDPQAPGNLIFGPLPEEVQQCEHRHEAHESEQAATDPDLVPPAGQLEIAPDDDRVRYLRHLERSTTRAGRNGDV